MFFNCACFLGLCPPRRSLHSLGFSKKKYVLSNILSNTWVSIYEHEYVKKSNNNKNTFN